MLKNWVFFISSRYIKSEKKGWKVSPGFLSAAGITVGVMALITVISVMNGFQMGFIEDIVEISSYHIRVENIDEANADEIRNLKGVKSVMPFSETKTLVNSPYMIEPCLVKGISADAESLDPAFFEQLNIFRGAFRPDIEKSVVLGRILAIRLGLNIGDSVSIVALNGGTFKNLRPEATECTITGLFRSGYSDFDSSMIIMAEKSLLSIDEGAKLKYGVKLDNRFRDSRAVEQIIKLSGTASENVVSWRMYNRSLFSALKLEKNLMFILLGLIFLVVSFGIFNSTRRTIAEKQEEIGILRAIGATPSQIRQIFIFDGGIIGITGGIIGVILGLILTLNVNGILKIFSFGASSFLVNMPIRIMPSEVLIIFLSAVLFCIVSAYMASAKVSMITPQEVLRYE